MSAFTIGPESAFARMVCGVAAVEMEGIRKGKKLKKIQSDNQLTGEMFEAGRLLGVLNEDNRLTLLGLVLAGELYSGRKVVLPGVCS